MEQIKKLIIMLLNHNRSKILNIDSDILIKIQIYDI